MIKLLIISGERASDGCDVAYSGINQSSNFSFWHETGRRVCYIYLGREGDPNEMLPWKTGIKKNI